MDEKLIAQVVAESLKQVGAYGNKAPTGVGTTNLVHGPGGLFGIAGLEEDVISARITPRGISGMLKAMPSVYTNPEFPYITGIEETAGTEPSGECATCLSGESEACIQTAQFGRVCRESKELDIDKVMERINRGEIDLNLVNSIFGDDAWVPGAALSNEKLVNIATAWAMVEVGVLLQNKLIPMVWQGNPTNSIGNGYKEFPGLDILIGTNKVDAHTGVSCPALDSDVKDFNYSAVNTVDGNGNFMIVHYLEYMMAYLYHNAHRQNLLPTQWAIAMRPELWTELLRVWPAAYFSTRELALPNGNTNMIDATRVRELTQSMAAGMYIDVNGMRVPVVTDDGIYEYNSTNSANVPAGSFASDIYVVPLTYLGSRPATYIEYKDYRGTRRDIQELRGHEGFWTDDGKFMWVVEQQKWCYTLSGKIEPRIILRTPQLAGKIEHVLYSPLQHFRSFDQNSDYFFKGGVSQRTPTSLYSDWNLREQ